MSRGAKQPFIPLDIPQSHWEHKSRRYRDEAEKIGSPIPTASIGRRESDRAAIGAPVIRTLSEKPSQIPKSGLAQIWTASGGPPVPVLSNSSNHERRPQSTGHYVTYPSVPALSIPFDDSSVRQFDRDPYQHIDHLGSGAYGYVDTVRRVDQTSPIYARKTIRITSGRSREAQMKSAEKEFKILRRLKHGHVISVLELYCHRNRLSIIMLDVAEMDLKEYMERFDDLPHGEERSRKAEPLIDGRGCLIQAVDYLHEMRIKHKDLKPANILVKNNQFVITDFGIAKDLIDEETTASINESMNGSPMYMAPEVATGGKRGRAVDVFALGCIFLEISTCLVLGPGSRARFATHRDVNGSRAFSRCPGKILQWFLYLWKAHVGVQELPLDSISQKRFHTLPAQLAFMMLNPNPKTRITCRQLVQLTHGKTSQLNYYHQTTCDSCSGGSLWDNDNIPFHSVFKKSLYIPEQPLQTNIYFDWEEAKRMWLESHMWW